MPMKWTRTVGESWRQARMSSESGTEWVEWQKVSRRDGGTNSQGLRPGAATASKMRTTSARWRRIRCPAFSTPIPTGTARNVSLLSASRSRAMSTPMASSPSMSLPTPSTSSRCPRARTRASIRRSRSAGSFIVLP